jgi:hypothetical protein
MTWRWIRLTVGAWIIGGEWHGIVMRLWLIRDRAMEAVTKDGYVDLSRCKLLAEVLYEEMPGEWSLVATRLPDRGEALGGAER